MLFAFLIVLTSAKMVQKQWWVKLSTLQHNSAVVPNHTCNHCILYHHILTVKKKKESPLKNVLDDAVTVANFIRA